MKKISKSEFDLLFNNAKKSFDEAEIEYAKWFAKRDSMIKYYVNRFKRMDKKVTSMHKNLVLARARLNVIIELGNGTDVDFSKIKPQKQTPEPSKTGVSLVDPRNGELITVTDEEMKNLLDRR